MLFKNYKVDPSNSIFDIMLYSKVKVEIGKFTKKIKSTEHEHNLIR